MRVLLLSMPDSFEHTPVLAMRMPNGALASLAGNVDPHHQVAIADLILIQQAVGKTVVRLMHDVQPDVVGLSVMTFQRRTASELIRLIRQVKPDVKVVAGGYDPSLATAAYEPPATGVDFVVRGEGDLTFRDLIRHLERNPDPDKVPETPGLSIRRSNGFVHGPPRHVSSLQDAAIAPPRREARVWSGYTFLGRSVDVVETSRGCTYDCSFCSIIEMRGRNFHTLSFDRVLADIIDARRRGARDLSGR